MVTMELIQEKKWSEKSHLSTHASLALLGSLFILILLGYKELRKKRTHSELCCSLIIILSISITSPSLSNGLNCIYFTLIIRTFWLEHSKYSALEAFVSMRTECSGLKRKHSENKSVNVQTWNWKLRGGGRVTGKVPVRCASFVL